MHKIRPSLFYKRRGTNRKLRRANEINYIMLNEVKSRSPFRGIKGVTTSMNWRRAIFSPENPARHLAYRKKKRKKMPLRGKLRILCSCTVKKMNKDLTVLQTVYNWKKGETRVTCATFSVLCLLAFFHFVGMPSNSLLLLANY